MAIVTTTTAATTITPRATVITTIVVIITIITDIAIATVAIIPTTTTIRVMGVMVEAPAPNARRRLSTAFKITGASGKRACGRKKPLKSSGVTG